MKNRDMNKGTGSMSKRDLRLFHRCYSLPMRGFSAFLAVLVFFFFTNLNEAVEKKLDEAARASWGEQRLREERLSVPRSLPAEERFNGYCEHVLRTTRRLSREQRSSKEIGADCRDLEFLRECLTVTTGQIVSEMQTVGKTRGVPGIAQRSKASMAKFQGLAKQLDVRLKDLIRSAPTDDRRMSAAALRGFVEPLILNEVAYGKPAAERRCLFEEVAAKLGPVAELTQRLSHDPLRIFEYIRGHVAFIPGKGLRKNASATLADGEGSGAELANLLAASLRTANIQTRLVTGAVAIPQEQLSAWIGQDDALAVLRRAGVRYRTREYDGKPVVELDHIWVSARLPKGKGWEWTKMDPSFKKQGLEQTACFDRYLNLNPRALLSNLRARARQKDPSGNSAVGLRTSLVSSYFRTMSKQLRNYLAAHGKDAGDLQKQLQVRGTFETPYTVLRQSAPSATVPAEQLQLLSLQLGTDVRYAAPLASLTNCAIAVSYEVATPEDARILARFRKSRTLPVHLIRVKPVLRVDGKRVATGKAVAAGSAQALVVRVGERVERSCVRAMGRQVFIPAIARVNDQTLTRIQNRLAQANASTVDVLRSIGVSYLYQVQQFGDQLACRGLADAGVPYVLVRVSLEPRLHAPLNIPISASSPQLAIHCLQAREMGTAESLISSALARNALVQCGETDGLCAVRAFDAANTSGVGIVSVTPENAAAVLPDLSDHVTAATWQRLKHGVAAGSNVIVTGGPVEVGAMRGGAAVTVARSGAAQATLSAEAGSAVCPLKLGARDLFSDAANATLVKATRVWLDLLPSSTHNAAVTMHPVISGLALWNVNRQFDATTCAAAALSTCSPVAEVARRPAILNTQVISSSSSAARTSRQFLPRRPVNDALHSAVASVNKQLGAGGQPSVGGPSSAGTRTGYNRAVNALVSALSTKRIELERSGSSPAALQHHDSFSRTLVQRLNRGVPASPTVPPPATTPAVDHGAPVTPPAYTTRRTDKALPPRLAAQVGMLPPEGAAQEDSAAFSLLEADAPPLVSMSHTGTIYPIFDRVAPEEFVTGDPTAADLAATDEAPQTTAITKLAQQLENNPVKIYEYVKNNFEYQPYYGNMKGAAQTLREKAEKSLRSWCQAV